MADWQNIPVGDNSYRPRAKSSSIERLVNCYFEPSQGGAKTGGVVYGDPGLKLWKTVSSNKGGCRGLHADQNGFVWAVIGSEVWKVSSSKIAVKIGDIAGTGPCRMADDGVTVLITTGSALYYSDGADLFVQGTITGLGDVGYQDGYGLLTSLGGQDLWITSVDDLTTIDGLDFTTVDAQADQIKGMIIDQREVIIGKERTCEVFYNSGNASFPFERVPSGFIERGWASTGGAAAADGVVYFLGDDRRVYALNGYVPQPISTPDIESLISASLSASSAEAFIYEIAGHLFYHLGFPDLTLIYNITTGRWHEKRSYGLNRWRAQYHARLGDVDLVGDYENGNIYELDIATYTENGEILERIVTFPPLSPEPRRVFTYEMHADLEAGQGLTAGQGSDPTVMLSWTEDEGHTWSSDVEASAGKIGEYKNRAHFSRLGAGYSRTYRLRFTDPVKFALLGAQARMELGDR